MKCTPMFKFFQNSSVLDSGIENLSAVNAAAVNTASPAGTKLIKDSAQKQALSIYVDKKAIGAKDQKRDEILL